MFVFVSYFRTQPAELIRAVRFPTKPPFAHETVFSVKMTHNISLFLTLYLISGSEPVSSYNNVQPCMSVYLRAKCADLISALNFGSLLTASCRVDRADGQPPCQEGTDGAPSGNVGSLLGRLAAL